MLVHFFHSADRVFAGTRAADGANLPARFGPWTPFKSLELNRGQVQPGVDVDECLDDIETHGFHLTRAHVRITDQAVSGKD